jgi:two-component system sensor histidine kinase DesK
LIPRTAAAILAVRIVATLSLLVLIVPDATLLTGPAAPVAAPFGNWAWLAVVVPVVVLYLLYWLWIWPGRPGSGVKVLLVVMVPVAGLGQVVAPLSVTNDLWLYPAVVAGSVLPTRWAIAAVIAMAALAMAAILQLEASVTVQGVWSPTLAQRLAAGAQGALPVLIGGFGSLLATLLVRTNAELHAARAAVARLAVERERTRLARDLHDLLGHNLSLVAVKLELAKRLVGEADHPVAIELEEAHRVTRSTLREVRETVGGYRQPTLEGELAGARVALEAAGIDLVLHDDRSVLTSEVEAACAWIVREGVTNVLQHSGAGSCRISISHVTDWLVVAITDDGARGGAGGSGMGLKGLGERVSALGGTLAARRAGAGAGFELVARVPLRVSAAVDGAD